MLCVSFGVILLMYEVGDWVVCVDLNILTVGKEYQIVSIKGPYRRIIKDHGGMDGFVMAGTMFEPSNKRSSSEYVEMFL
jgi:hypothetical protein